MFVDEECAAQHEREEQEKKSEAERQRRDRDERTFKERGDEGMVHTKVVVFAAIAVGYLLSHPNLILRRPSDSLETHFDI